MIEAYPKPKFKEVFNSGGYSWVDQHTTRAIRTFFSDDGTTEIHEMIEQVDGDVVMKDVGPLQWAYLVTLQKTTFPNYKGVTV